MFIMYGKHSDSGIRQIKRMFVIETPVSCADDEGPRATTDERNANTRASRVECSSTMNEGGLYERSYPSGRTGRARRAPAAQKSRGVGQGRLCGDDGEGNR